MTDKPAANVAFDGEYDWLEYLQTIWAAKYLVLVTALAGLALGFVYTSMATRKYDVRVPFTVNLYPYDAKQICQNIVSVDCIKQTTSALLVNQTGPGWVKEPRNDVLHYATTEVKPPEEYSKMLDTAGAALNQQLLQQAKNKIAVINGEVPGAMLATEVLADNLLTARMTVYSIEEKAINAVDFGKPSISVSSPKTKFILVETLILGMVFGVIFVLLREKLQRRRAQKA